MAVMVDGKERAGLSLDATEGMTLQANKVRVMNGKELTALFEGGMLNAALIMARKLVAVNPAGGARVTVSEFDDPFIRFYHPDGVTLAAKVGLEEIDPNEQILGSETANAPQADGSTTAIIQCYNTAGLRRWALTLSGPVTPANQRFYWRAYALTGLKRNEGIEAAQEADPAAAVDIQTVDRGTECWQFVDLQKDTDYQGLSPYSGMIFKYRLTEAQLRSVSGRTGAKLPAGVYFSVEPHMLASSTTDNPRWGRWRYSVDANGFLSDPTEFEIQL